jgi:hypothetical protein
MNVDISASSYADAIETHLRLGGDVLDLISCESFKSYLWDRSNVLRSSVYSVSDALPETPVTDLFYWRTSELRQVVRDLPGLAQFAEKEKQEASSYYNDWAYHFLQKDTVGVFSEYDAFMKDWSDSRFKRKYRTGRLFLELVFGYNYERVSSSVKPDPDYLNSAGEVLMKDFIRLSGQVVPLLESLGEGVSPGTNVMLEDIASALALKDVRSEPAVTASSPALTNDSVVSEVLGLRRRLADMIASLETFEGIDGDHFRNEIDRVFTLVCRALHSVH